MFLFSYELQKRIYGDTINRKHTQAEQTDAIIAVKDQIKNGNFVTLVQENMAIIHIDGNDFFFIARW